MEAAIIRDEIKPAKIWLPAKKSCSKGGKKEKLASEIGPTYTYTAIGLMATVGDESARVIRTRY